MRGLLRRYRRLPWFVHLVVAAHLLALSCIPTYYVLRWYAARQLVKNQPWSAPPTVEQFNHQVQLLQYDHMKVGGDGWITFWYNGGLYGAQTHVAWQLRYPFRYVAKGPIWGGRTAWVIFEDGRLIMAQAVTGEEPLMTP